MSDDIDQFDADRRRVDEILNSESIEEVERFINEELPAIERRLEDWSRPATMDEIAAAVADIVAWIPRGRA